MTDRVLFHQSDAPRFMHGRCPACGAGLGKATLGPHIKTDYWRCDRGHVIAPGTPTANDADERLRLRRVRDNWRQGRPEGI